MSFETVGVKLITEDGTKFCAILSSAENCMKDFGKSSNQTMQQMPGLSDIAVGALHKVGAIAIEAFAAAGQAAVGFFKDSIGAAGDFEVGMNTFTAVAGGALDEAGLKTEDFRDLFLSLGKELPVSTAEVQDAATEMIKGGIDPAVVSVGGLRQTIQFAAAAMDGDLKGAAETSAKILGGWAEQGATAAEQADLLTKATDLLTKAANASTVDVKDLALGLYNVQGTAKTTGLSLDETTTALAELAPRFASSSEAGTSFKNFLVRLQPTTKPAAAAMKDLGLYTDDAGSAFFDAQGKFVGTAKASQLLQDATKGLTDAQKVQALQTIFGNDAMNTASAFAELGAQGFDDMASSMEKQSGVADTAKTKQAGFNVALDNFHGSVEALQITIGSVLLPVLTTLFNDYLAPGINILTDLANSGAVSDETFSKLGPTMQTVAVILGGLWTGIQVGIDLIGDLITSFQSTGEESSGLSSILTDLSGVWSVVQSTVEKVMDAYEEIINAVLPIIQRFIKDHGDEIVSIFKGVWDTIIDIVDLAMAVINKIIVPLLTAIAQFISDNQNTILRIITNVWNVIKSVIDIALALIQGIVKAAMALLNGDTEGAMTALSTMFSRIWEDIKAIFSAVWDTIVLILEGVWEDIKSKAELAWEGIKISITTVLDALIGLFIGLPNAVSGVGEAIVNAIWDGIRAQWYKLVEWFTDRLDELKAQLPFSEPKDPQSPLRNLKRSGRSIVEQLQIGIKSAGPLQAPGMSSVPASPMAIMAAGSSMTTNNNQRSVNLSYHTTYAPPASQSLALASALAG